MDFIQNQTYKLKKKLHDVGLYDMRILTMLVIAVVAVSVFWNGAKIVQQNFELAQKVEQINQENQILELENRNKELQNEYLATNEFAELTARRVFGKAAPGEQVYIVPKDVALGALSGDYDPLADEVALQAPSVAENKPKWQQNLEAWLNIYFGS